jgi:hypothetical protein
MAFKTQLAIKQIKIFHSKAFQKLPKLFFLFEKIVAIRQPCLKSFVTRNFNQEASELYWYLLRKKACRKRRRK